MASVDKRANETGSGTPDAYTGILRQFTDDTWGALCFELGLITRSDTEKEALRQMAELIGFELECIAEGDPPTPASPELIADFMTCDVDEPGEDQYMSEPFRNRWFRLPRDHMRELATV
jgi:predicted RNase H-like HicB family nuclease